MTQTPTPRTDAEEGAIFAAFSEDRISAKQAIRAMAAESRRHEREAACRPSPVVISEMETPTPETDKYSPVSVALGVVRHCEVLLDHPEGAPPKKDIELVVNAAKILAGEVSRLRSHAPHTRSEGMSETKLLHEAWNEWFSSYGGSIDTTAMRMAFEAGARFATLSAPTPDAVVEVAPPMKEGE